MNCTQFHAVRRAPSPAFSIPGMLSTVSTVLLLMTGTAAAATIVVDSNVDNIEGGLCTLRAAVVAANTNGPAGNCPAGDADVRDTIEVPFANGIYHLSVLPAGEDDALGGDLDLYGMVSIVGTGNLPAKVESGLADRIFDVKPGASVELVHMELSDGSGDFGGNIRHFGASLVLRDLLIQHGDASSQGGALYCAGSLVVERTQFLRNRGVLGGAGGGIAAVENCLGTIDASTFLENEATSGGGLRTGDGTSLTITNSTFWDNRADIGGGGIHGFGGTLHLRNVTLAGNDADFDDDNEGKGGGIYVSEEGAVSVMMRNSIIALNSDEGSDPDCYGSITSEGYNLIKDNSDGCNIAGEMTGVLFGEDPNFDALFDPGNPTITGLSLPQVLPLLPGSAAIDAGSPDPIARGPAPAPCEPLDELGTERPIDGDGDGEARCDMGAFEFDARLFQDGFEASNEAL